MKSVGVMIWDPATGKQTAKVQDPNAPLITKMAWRPDGTAIATGNVFGQLQLWDPATGKEIAALGKHERMVNAIVWRPDGKALATVGDDDTVRIWPVPAGK
jgi:WD40 repeat protein